MVLLSIIGASLVYTGFVTSQPTSLTFRNIYWNDLKGALDCMHTVSKDYVYNKEGYLYFAEKIMKYTGLLQYMNFELTLSEFLTIAESLRTTLVKGDAEDIIISDEPETNVDMIGDFLLNIRISLDDVKTHITEWKERSEGKQCDIKVTDPRQLLWFTEHGFNEKLLKSITIEELKLQVDSIYGRYKPMQRLLKLYGTRFLLDKPHDSSSAHARVDTLSGSAEAISLIDNYLKSVNHRVPRMISNHIVDSLRKLGRLGTPLRKYDEKYQDAYSYRRYIKQMEDCFFLKSHLPRYLEVLSEVCQYVQLEAIAFLKCFSSTPKPQNMVVLKQYGLVDLDQNDALDVKNKIDLLYHEHGLMANLCNAMHMYNTSQEPTIT